MAVVSRMAPTIRTDIPLEHHASESTINFRMFKSEGYRFSHE
jgi:hypothetical protein